ncbi:aldo/keto reductase [Sphaerisporangium sp. NPDC088356]|uniref:aldo/keto reductase n=1 Tax=Sphaerisporangium sp. NPDC088356 TaxID=3154871 RepID=UPI00343771FB
MRYTRLGRTGPVISNIGLGSLALTGAYGHVDNGEALNLIRKALDAGVTIIDTAGFYAAGQVERLVGRAVAGRADEVVVCTRGGVRRARPGRPATFDGRLDYLERSCESSLERLGVDCIDLYYLHCQDERVPVEASMARLSRLVKAGKIRYVGLSSGTVHQLRRAHAVHPITAIAIEYSLWGLRAQPDLLAAARQMGITVVAARPLGRGFLTSRIRTPVQLGGGDWRHEDPRFQPENLRLSVGRLREIEAAAAQLDVGTGRLALGWLLSQGDHIVPVPSTRDPVHLEMNLAASAVELAPGTRDKLARVFPAARFDQSASTLL